MDRRLRIAGIAGAVAASALILSSPSDTFPPLPGPAAGGSGAARALAEGLDEPRAVAADGARVLVAERGGSILAYSGGALEEVAVLRAAGAPDGGLLGLAVPGPGGPVYAYHTYEDGGLWNRVVRISEEGGRVSGIDVVLDGIPGSRFSNGGAMGFGPDGMLYVATGSVSDSLALSSDPSSLAGKVLRVRPDGSVPGDNPSPGSAVYASGLRNPQGLAWGPGGELYVADEGPGKADELNVVEPGADYGWPGGTCGPTAAACYDPAVGPGGLAYYPGGPLAEGGALVLAGLRAPGLYAVDPSGIDDSPSPILGGLGRIRGAAPGPGGELYVITSNTDGRGFPGPGDDRLVVVER